MTHSNFISMNLAAESPLQSSSSSEDFAALLDAELQLELTSSDSSPNEEEAIDDEKNDSQERRAKRHRVEECESSDDLVTSTGVETIQEQIGASTIGNNDICPPHPGFFKGLCMRCGQQEEDDGSGVAFGYIHKDLRLDTREIERLRGADLNKLMRLKKLILILDLDHTLLNSTRLADISSQEEYLLGQVDSVKDDLDRSIFRLDSMLMLTKLRPFVHKFLKEASSLFEMYVYTMAERSYAMEIVKLLDPGRVYFDSKVITQADCTQRHQKGLDVVLGAESIVVILDDTEAVWSRHKENMIQMERYHFFASSCRQFGFSAKSLSESMKDERESDGALATILNVLRRAHRMFFDPVLGSDMSSRDVRKLYNFLTNPLFSLLDMEASMSSSDGESVETIEASLSEKDREEAGIDKIHEGPASTENVVGKESQVSKQDRVGSNTRCNDTGDKSLVPKTNMSIQLEPEVGMAFHSEDQAYLFYNTYAQRKGFSVRKGHLGRRKDGTVRNRVFLCSNEGTRQKHSTHVTKKPREVVRTNCMARMEFKVSRDGIWVVSKIIYEHNHPLVRFHKSHLLRSHRRQLQGQQDGAGHMLEKSAQTPEFPIEEAHDAESIGFLLKDQGSYLHTNRMRELEKGDVQLLLEFLKAKQLEDPSFFYAIQLDDREQVTNFFWADSRSKIDYTYFGDVVLFDTSFHPNKNEIPFAPFIGINHHKQIVLFGAAIMLDETTESFVWLFKTFMVAMSGLQPQTIFTDNCPALSRAISMTLPEACHRLCLWHIIQNSAVHVSNVYTSDTNFQADFKDCTYEESSEEEFCSKWVRLIHKYDLSGNSWLEDVYASRERWALVYNKNSFSAFMMSVQWGENMKNHFKKHFNRKLPLSKFLEHCLKSVNRFREKELYEDYKSRQTKPILLVDMPMLNEAAESYTRLMYSEFEEEFKSQLSCLCEPIGMDGTAYTFKVSLPGKHSFGIVELKPSNFAVSCSCRKFESVGILCMHALKVLNNNNILHLPSHYILKRWSKYANMEIVSGRHHLMAKGDGQDHLTVQYTRVCHKAVTIAVKGAFSEDALQIFDQELDKLIAEVEHVLHMAPLNRQTDDVAIIDSFQQDILGGKRKRGKKNRIKDGQDAKQKKKLQSHSDSVNKGTIYQPLQTKEKANQLMINESSHVPYHREGSTSYGNSMPPLQPSACVPFPQETLMPAQETFAPSQGLFDHTLSSQGANNASITWCTPRGSIGGVPMQVMQGQPNNYVSWVIQPRNLPSMAVPQLHVDHPMHPSVPGQHQSSSRKLTFDINKGTDTAGHVQH